MFIQNRTRARRDFLKRWDQHAVAQDEEEEDFEQNRARATRFLTRWDQHGEGVLLMQNSRRCGPSSLSSRRPPLRHLRPLSALNARISGVRS
jgi:hypothetical protein